MSAELKIRFKVKIKDHNVFWHRILLDNSNLVCSEIRKTIEIRLFHDKRDFLLFMSVADVSLKQWNYVRLLQEQGTILSRYERTYSENKKLIARILCHLQYSSFQIQLHEWTVWEGAKQLPIVGQFLHGVGVLQRLSCRSELRRNLSEGKIMLRECKIKGKI
jgi:hypothetical protein